MLDIKIGPTSFRPSCQLEGVHTRNKDLSLFHGCGLNNILMLSFWGPSSGIIYIFLCISTVTHALLKDQIYKTKKIQCSYNSVMAVERLVVMDQLLTTHFMSKCYTVLIHLWTLSGLQKNWWGLAWMSSQLRIIGSIQQQHDRVRGLGSTLQFEIITTPQVRVFTLWLIKISKNLNYAILLDTSQNWSSNMSICDLNEKKIASFDCSLLRNPVQSKKHYRLYIVHKIPQLRVLDFQRIRQKVKWR